MEPRWEDDERGHGVADGRRLAGEIDAFRRMISAPDWVAEQPEAHLLPHIRSACDGPGADFALEAYDVDPDGTLAVTLHPRRPLGRGEVRAALFALSGQIAESATYMRQRPEPLGSQDVVFDMVTGIPAGDGPFATHGHLVRFRVRPPADA